MALILSDELNDDQLKYVAGQLGLDLRAEMTVVGDPTLHLHLPEIQLALIKQQARAVFAIAKLAYHREQQGGS